MHIFDTLDLHHAQHEQLLRDLQHAHAAYVVRPRFTRLPRTLRDRLRPLRPGAGRRHRASAQGGVGELAA